MSKWNKPASNKTPMLLGVGGCGCLLFLAVVGIGGFFAYQWSQEKAETEARALEASMLVTQGWEKLALYKTNRAANSDQPNLITESNQLAKRAQGISPSAGAGGLEILSRVWSHRWHLMSSDDYRGAAWAEDDSATLAALATNSEPSTYLARAWTLAYGCHLQGNPNPENKVCADATSAITSAKKNMGGAPGWLRFELVWMEADYWNRHGHYAYRKKNHSAASRSWNKVLEVCQSPIEPMSSGPVNDEELMESCITAAGAVDDYYAWFAWAKTMREDDIKDHRRTRSTTMKTIFRTADPKCRSPRLKLRTVRGVKNYPRIDFTKNNAHPFCAAAGLMAMDCWRYTGPFESYRFRVPALNGDWVNLQNAGRSSGGLASGCYIDK
jgi:hypothetical protein